MHTNDRLMVEGAYAACMAGDVDAALALFADQVAFAVRLPAGTPSFIGQGRGKALFGQRVKLFLEQFELLEYRPVRIIQRGPCLDARVRYHYRHRGSGLTIDGTMSHVWHFADHLAVRYEVVHDAARMGAYFRLVAQAGHKEHA